MVLRSGQSVSSNNLFCNCTAGDEIRIAQPFWLCIESEESADRIVRWCLWAGGVWAGAQSKMAATSARPPLDTGPIAAGRRTPARRPYRLNLIHADKLLLTSR